METQIIGNNIKRLRIATGLSQHNLGIMLGISKRTIASLESGKNIDMTVALKLKAFFFMYSLDQLFQTEVKIEDDLRDVLIKHYKTKKSDYLNLLSKTPTIVYAIRFKLLKDSFFDVFRETNEINKYFLKIGWDFKGPSITNALSRMQNIIEIEMHESKANTKIYKRKLG